MIGYKCSTVPKKPYWCAFHTLQRYKHTFISLVSDSHTKDMTHFTFDEQMDNSVVQ